MGHKLSARTRELGAAWIASTMIKQSGVTLEEAARLVAGADCQNWDALAEGEREYYRRCTRNLMERISEPPHGLPMIADPLYEMI